MSGWDHRLSFSDITKAKRHAVLVQHSVHYGVISPADQQDILDGRCRFRISEDDKATAILDYAFPHGPGPHFSIIVMAGTEGSA